MMEHLRDALKRTVLVPQGAEHAEELSCTA